MRMSFYSSWPEGHSAMQDVFPPSLNHFFCECRLQHLTKSFVRGPYAIREHVDLNVVCVGSILFNFARTRWRLRLSLFQGNIVRRVCRRTEPLIFLTLHLAVACDGSQDD